MREIIYIIWVSLLLWGCQPETKKNQFVKGSSENYLAQRAGLLEIDGELAFDSDMVLTEAEKSLNQKLVDLRKEMTANYLDESFFPPSRNFYQSKGHIEETSLFHLLRKMPKGGITHLHSSALCDSWWIVDRAIQSENCYVYWEEDTDQYTKGQLQFFYPQDVPNGFYSTSELDQKDPEFSDKLFDLLTLDQSMSLDSVDVWSEFESIFQRLDRFTYFRSVYEDYHIAAFDTLASDGIQHVEIRARLSGGLYDLDREDSFYTPDSLVLLLKSARDKIRQKYPDFTLKLIYTSLRLRSKEVIWGHLIKAFELRKKYPDLVVGFDLVANEDDGHTTLFFLDNWLKLDSLEKAYGIDLPLFLHDGESDWSSNLNLYDAVLLNSRRIGHGFNLNHFPTLQDEIKRRDICIEVNPLSNQILGYISDLRIHPASYMMKRGVQYTISSDDPGIFAYNGLSYDFWTIFLAWELDLKSLKKLVWNSIDYSALTETEKQEARKSLTRKWNDFIEYSTQYLNNEPNL